MAKWELVEEVDVLWFMCTDQYCFSPMYIALLNLNNYKYYSDLHGEISRGKDDDAANE